MNTDVVIVFVEDKKQTESWRIKVKQIHRLETSSSVSCQCRFYKRNKQTKPPNDSFLLFLFSFSFFSEFISLALQRLCIKSNYLRDCSHSGVLCLILWQNLNTWDRMFCCLGRKKNKRLDTVLRFSGVCTNIVIRSISHIWCSVSIAESVSVVLLSVWPGFVCVVCIVCFSGVSVGCICVVYLWCV